MIAGAILKFCAKCGAYMRQTRTGYKCSKCGNEENISAVEVKQIKSGQTATVDVVFPSDENYLKVAKTCPSCGNPEAFSKTSFSSGEHAGVRQERSIERLTCTKCRHSWTED
jgi:DNA-directed RNA polymerase subunit M/transcription elongation factor TFIIS